MSLLSLPVEILVDILAGLSHATLTQNVTSVPHAYRSVLQLRLVSRAFNNVTIAALVVVGNKGVDVPFKRIQVGLSRTSIACLCSISQDEHLCRLPRDIIIISKPLDLVQLSRNEFHSHFKNYNLASIMTCNKVDDRAANTSERKSIYKLYCHHLEEQTRTVEDAHLREVLRLALTALPAAAIHSVGRTAGSNWHIDQTLRLLNPPRVEDDKLQQIVVECLNSRSSNHSLGFTNPGAMLVRQERLSTSSLLQPSAFERVQTLTVIFTNPEDQKLSAGAWVHVLRLCPQLRKLVWHQDQAEPTSLLDELGQQSIRDIVLRNVRIGLPDMKQYLTRQHKGHLRSLSLMGVTNSEQEVSWREMLDGLRKENCLKYVLWVTPNGELDLWTRGFDGIRS